MATLAQMQTDLASVETALRNLYSGVDFSSGGKLSVTISNQAKFLQSEISRLKLSIAASSGNLTGANQDRMGIDVPRSSSNGDGLV